MIVNNSKFVKIQKTSISSFFFHLFILGMTDRGRKLGHQKSCWQDISLKNYLLQIHDETELRTSEKLRRLKESELIF